MLLILTIIYTLYIFIRFYASIMEIGYVAKAKKGNPVILNFSSFLKAGNYRIATQKMELVSILYDLLIFFWWIGVGLDTLDRYLSVDDVLLKTVLFVDIFIAVNYIFSLPFDLYKTFVLDREFGFSTIDIKTYITDQIKSSVLFLVFGTLVIW